MSSRTLFGHTNVANVNKPIVDPNKITRSQSGNLLKNSLANAAATKIFAMSMNVLANRSRRLSVKIGSIIVIIDYHAKLFYVNIFYLYANIRPPRGRRTQPSPQDCVNGFYAEMLVGMAM